MKISQTFHFITADKLPTCCNVAIAIFSVATQPGCKKCKF